MEFPELGTQCSKSGCNRLDFIPLKCQCLTVFCREHFTEHCLSRTCSYYSKLNKEICLSSDSPIYKCHQINCKNASYIKLACPKCDNHFCIQHRFHAECPEVEPDVLLAERQRIAEPQQQFAKAKALVEVEITRKLRLFQQSSSKAKTALKVQLMKLKSRAKGEMTIPTVDRVYFMIRKPTNNSPKVVSCKPGELDIHPKENSQSVAVFVCKDWSLGRAIDSFSNICCVKNENNNPTAAKLRIFREVDGMGICLNEMDKKISTLIEMETLVNGDNIILDYISQSTLSNQNDVYFVEMN